MQFYLIVFYVAILSDFISFILSLSCKKSLKCDEKKKSLANTLQSCDFFVLKLPCD